MISRAGNKGFFAAHYDWIALGCGLAALVGAAVFYVIAIGEDPEEKAAASVAEVSRLKPAESGVKGVDMAALEQAGRLMRSPSTLTEISAKDESFLASERRIVCKNKECARAIPGSDEACKFCGTKQEKEVKVVLDADGDGLPDEWERKYGLNPNDASDATADADNDGFTNLEEYVAKTDPTNKKDHPDYLDSLEIVLPLKETYMPFIFTKAMKIPSGWRCEFFDPKKKDDHGRMGRAFTAVTGTELEGYGFVLKSYTAKEVKRAIKGGQGMTKTVDVSEVVLVRKSDSKEITLVIAQSKREKPAPVDVQATLAYKRGTVKNFDVVPGSELDLNGTKYSVTEITPVGKGAKVTVETVTTGKKRVLEAIEP